MNPQIFRAYDVRGVAETDLTDAVVTDLARAYGTMIRRRGGRRVCLGRDCRTHGARLRDAFARGLVACGLRVLDVGVVPTPLLYYAVFHHGADGGTQITGSHNPPEFNGFKMMAGPDTIYGAEIEKLRGMIEARDFEAGEGSVRETPIEDAYIDEVARRVRVGPRPSGRRLRVAVDGGNGTGGPTALRLLERLGVAYVPMYIEMDGTFPNHHPDPTVEANIAELRERVVAEGLDLGIAYDGDADRIGVIDDAGAIVWGDRLTILLARDVLKENPGAAIVSEVKCSETLFDDIAAHGGRPIMSAVGHSIIKERMKREGALLGGEMSGHIFFRHRWYGFDDAIYTSARLLEILARTDEPLSALLADVPRTEVTPEIRLGCPDAVKFEIVAQAVAYFKARYPVVDIDGARVDFGDGWGLIRASNTQPVIVLRAEARTPESLARIRGTLVALVAEHRGV